MSELELRHEVEATLRAHQEVGQELEPQLVEGLADKLEAEIERRVAQRRPVQRHGHRAVTPLVLGSLGIGIPLIAAAGGTAGAAGVIAVCIALVLINLFWAVTRR